jgi:hypothetical protein
MREILPPAHPFTGFARYQLDGNLYMQSTGSNALFTEFLNWYAEVAQTSFEAQPVSGFLDPDRDGWVESHQGHRHTVVTDTIRESAYAYLDATPANMDPQAEAGAESPRDDRIQVQVEKQEGRPEPEIEENPKEGQTHHPLEAEDLEVLGVLPKRIELVRDYDSRGSSDENEDYAQEAERLDPRQPIYEMLDRLLREFGQVIEAEARQSPLFRGQPNLVGIPGINVAAYTNVIKLLMNREITAEVALMRLQALDSGYRGVVSLGTPRGPTEYSEQLRQYLSHQMEEANGDFAYLFRDYFYRYRNNLSKFFDQIERQTLERREVPYVFLLSPEWRNKIEELNSVLVRLDYGELLSDEIIFEPTSLESVPDFRAPVSCKAALVSSAD